MSKATDLLNDRALKTLLWMQTAPMQSTPQPTRALGIVMGVIEPAEVGFGSDSNRATIVNVMIRLENAALVTKVRRGYWRLTTTGRTAKVV